MRKTVVIYKSKYGATKRYAQWLSAKLNCALLENKGLKAADIKAYDTIILGGGVYAGGIGGVSFFQKNREALRGKKLVIFAVGASPEDEKALEELKKRTALPDIPLFYCRGAWDEGKMGFMDKTLCRLLKKAVAKQDPASYEPWQAALAACFDKACDWTEEKNLEPVLRAAGG